MSSIEKQFVPYTLALKLKELGFDEECLGRYGMNSKKLFLDAKLTFKNSADLYSDIPNDWCNDFVAAPLWQQAFEWMSEKHELVVDWNHSQYDNAGSYISVNIKNIHLEETIVGVYKSYEEAQEECLTKLIKIVQDGNH